MQPLKPTKTAWNPKGIACHFDAGVHRYWTDQVSEFVSVTGFVKHYFPVFDAPKVAAGVAAKTGKPVEQIHADWSRKGTLAAEMGTRVHENQEALVSALIPPNQPRDERERGIMASGWAAVDWMRRQGWTLVAAEQIIFSENLGLAGTIDLAMRDEAGALWILDWKTNEEIKAEGFKGARALAPISHLQDCDLSRYSLQLSTYERILRLEGYAEPLEKIHRALIHLTPERWTPINVPYLAAETAEMALDLKLSAWQVPF
jgi:hypothetical protein